MATKNQIILDDVIHEFIQDKPKVDNCNNCSLQEICYERFERFLCAIFFDKNKQIQNGHFEIKE